VSLAARSKASLEEYSTSRHGFAVLIAEEWFNMLETLPEPRHRELKSCLETRTLVGEYVGHPDHQHLVKYKSVGLTFYALVDNLSPVTCLPPVVALTMLRYFGFSSVKFTKLGVFTDLGSLYTSLSTLFRKVSEESLEEGEEGSVLYFVKNVEPNGVIEAAENHCLHDQPRTFKISELEAAHTSQETIALGKLKTLEYRIFRKLREKLKSLKGQSNYTKTFHAFEEQVQELVQGHSLPKPLKHYMDIALAAFELIAQSPHKAKDLGMHYVDFLEELLTSPPSKAANSHSLVLVTPPLYFADAALQEVSQGLGFDGHTEHTWSEHDRPACPRMYAVSRVPVLTKAFDRRSVFICAGFSTESKTRLVARLADMKRDQAGLSGASGLLQGSHGKEATNLLKAKSLPAAVDRYFNAAIEGRLNAIDANLYGCLGDVTATDLIGACKDLFSRLEDGAHQFSTVVLLNLGFPGVGKTSLAEALTAHLKGSDVHLQVVSSDDIRAQAMQKYRNLPREAAFNASAKTAQTKFDKGLASALQIRQPKRLVFVDKNVSPSAINQLINSLKVPDDVSLTIVGLAPLARAPLTVSSARYPFSMWSLVESLFRLKARRTHPTLNGPASDRIDVALKIFQNFRDCNLEELAERSNFTLIRLPFTEEPDREVPHSLSATICASLVGPANAQAILKELDLSQLDFKAVSPLSELVSLLQTTLNTELPQVLQARPPSYTPTSEEFKAPPRLSAEEFKTPQSTTTEAIALVTPSIQPDCRPEGNCIDLSKCLGPSLLLLLRSAIRAFKEWSPLNKAVKEDFSILQQAPEYSAGGALGSFLNYPDQLLAEVMDPLKGSLVYLQLTHLLYIPNTLLLAEANVVGQRLKSPYLTLMTGKHRMHISEPLSFSEPAQSISKESIPYEGQRVEVYRLVLSPPWILRPTN
jgi:hypothetical protein